MQLLLEHVEDELALHGVLDELILADVSVTFFINSIPRILAKIMHKVGLINESKQPYVRYANSHQVFILLDTSQPATITNIKLSSSGQRF